MATLICDYDGTFHESIKIYAPAFRRAYDYLVRINEAEPRTWTDEEISIWLGYSSKDMWNSFMPDLPKEIKEKCSSMIGSEMICRVKGNEAALYEGSIEVWNSLRSKGHVLVFLSNCKRRYMDAHRAVFNLDKYFEGFYCTEDFDFAPKYEIFKRIKRDFKAPYIVVGDRYQDMEIARIHGLKSIGCAYGYGTREELQNATLTAESCIDIIYLTEKIQQVAKED